VADDNRWDRESYCVKKCGNPATHQHPVGMAYETPVVEYLCYKCWKKKTRGNW